MQDRDNVLWLQCWRDRQIDFHQQTVNQFLTRFWPRLDPDISSRVFVPLCGKSLDMIWLAEQGHQVIGVELSPIAVGDFFRENGLRPNPWRDGVCNLRFMPSAGLSGTKGLTKRVRPYSPTFGRLHLFH